jgi:hypothetical protein
MVAADMLGVEGLRYLFYPKYYPHAPGYPRLDVLLPERSKVTEGTAVCLTFDSVTAGGVIERVTLQHELAVHEAEYQVCAGRMILSGMTDEPNQIFTFGGSMSLGQRAWTTLCQITSPAPLIPLRLAYRHSVSMRLAEEVEALFARRRAAWACDPGAFDQRLAAADPLKLYCACLLTLSIKFSDYDIEAEHDFIRHFTHFLQSEIESLQQMGNWPLNRCLLEDIL